MTKSVRAVAVFHKASGRGGRGRGGRVFRFGPLAPIKQLEV